MFESKDGFKSVPETFRSDILSCEKLDTVIEEDNHRDDEEELSSSTSDMYSYDNDSEIEQLNSIGAYYSESIDGFPSFYKEKDADSPGLLKEIYCLSTDGLSNNSSNSNTAVDSKNLDSHLLFKKKKPSLVDLNSAAAAFGIVRRENESSSHVEEKEDFVKKKACMINGNGIGVDCVNKENIDNGEALKIPARSFGMGVLPRNSVLKKFFVHNLNDREKEEKEEKEEDDDDDDDEIVFNSNTFLNANENDNKRKKENIAI